MIINYQPSTTNRLSRWWLIIGVTALAVAGLFALVLVIARTPSLAELPLFDRMFHKSLVVHVDLSVLVWFLSIACLMWSLLVRDARQVFPFLEEAALIAFALGALLMAGSALDPQGEPLMSNYIPVLTSPLFFLGLALLLCGVGLMILKLLTSLWDTRFDKPLRFGIGSAGVIAVAAIIAFIWSRRKMGPFGGDDLQAYYDLLFWGGGHVLQFVHVQMLMVCWLMLILALQPAAAPHHVRKDAFLYILFSIGLVAGLLTPCPYLFYSIDSAEHRLFFIHMMSWANGIAPAILALLILPSLRRASRDALWSALVMSIVLFLYGGILGGMIEGQNVVIPAHYHGAIVGVTLAFMGVAYLLLPQFGWRDARASKLAFWQPIIYGGGQTLHISGLAWSGGYGVLRKTPGAINEISASVKAGMALMGIGGLIAIIGGLLFVVVMIQAMWPRRLPA